MKVKVLKPQQKAPSRICAAPPRGGLPWLWRRIKYDSQPHRKHAAAASPGGAGFCGHRSVAAAAHAMPVLAGGCLRCLTGSSTGQPRRPLRANHHTHDRRPARAARSILPMACPALPARSHSNASRQQRARVTRRRACSRAGRFRGWPHLAPASPPGCEVPGRFAPDVDDVKRTFDAVISIRTAGT